MVDGSDNRPDGSNMPWMEHRSCHAIPSAEEPTKSSQDIPVATPTPEHDPQWTGSEHRVCQQATAYPRNDNGLSGQLAMQTRYNNKRWVRFQHDEQGWVDAELIANATMRYIPKPMIGRDRLAGG